MVEDLHGVSAVIVKYGTYASIAILIVSAVAFYFTPVLIRIVFRWWPNGLIRRLRQASKSGEEWPFHSKVQPDHVLARDEVIARQNEAVDALAQAMVSESLYRLWSIMNDIAQGMIGVVMLTAFVRERVSPATVGVWGVIILVSSQSKRIFSPELKVKDAKRSADLLRALIRFSQARLLALDASSTNGEHRRDALVALMYQVADRLTEILNPGTNDVIPRLANDPAEPASPRESSNSEAASAVSPGKSAALSGPHRADTTTKAEDPRLMISVAPMKESTFQNTLGVTLRNVGGSEANDIKLADIVLVKSTIQFPVNIPALMAGESSHPIVPRIKDAGPLVMHDMPRAMFAEWDHQPISLAEVIPCPASATFSDFFKAQSSERLGFMSSAHLFTARG